MKLNMHEDYVQNTLGFASKDHLGNTPRLQHLVPCLIQRQLLTTSRSADSEGSLICCGLRSCNCVILNLES